MIRTLQTVNGVNVDAQKKAAVAMKRGAFVSVNENAGTVALATNLAACVGLAVRDFVVTQESAMGYAVSDYDDSQDIIAINEFLGVRPLVNGERFATTEYDVALNDTTAAAGKYLTITNGKLAESPSNAATSIVSLGWVIDAGIHKILGFKFVK